MQLNHDIAKTIESSAQTPKPRRQHRSHPTMSATHAIRIPAGHPLADAYPAGAVLMLAAHEAGAALAPGRYLDDAGRVRQCLAGPSGAPYLVGDDAAILARIVAVQVDEDGAETAGKLGAVK